MPNAQHQPRLEAVGWMPLLGAHRVSDASISSEEKSFKALRFAIETPGAFCHT
jgi:hypothetical protein